MEKEKIRQLNREEYLEFLPRKKPRVNLPEFQSFQSDHLVLIPQIASYPFYDRLRGSSAFSSTKFNRQSTAITTPTATGGSVGSPRLNQSSTKRSSRSRQSHDTTNNYEQQQQAQMMRPTSLRQMTNKFDSLACFQQVSRLVISFSDSFSKAEKKKKKKRKKIHCPKGKYDENETPIYRTKFDYNRE